MERGCNHRGDFGAIAVHSSGMEAEIRSGWVLKMRFIHDRASSSWSRSTNESHRGLHLDRAVVYDMQSSHGT
jgi:hypothetical protein